MLTAGITSQAQAPQGGAPGRSMQTPPSIGHLFGKIIDSSGKAVSNASVILLQSQFDSASRQAKDVLLKSAISQSNGEFSFSGLPVMGTLKLQVTAVGFSILEQTAVFQKGGFDKDLGNLEMKSDSKVLESVYIAAPLSSMKLDIDKKVFNVEKNVVSAGGTAVDVMRNVPSVQVDIDGNVKLRNASPQLYIDGRPTTLSLDQIPADAIQSVEVITNPSAKYDASGGNAGILNIVLKKNKQFGYNGNLMAGVDSRGGWNGGGNFNIRQDKFNFSVAVMSNNRQGLNTGTTDRLNLGDTMVHVFQDNTNKQGGGFQFGKVGLDYYISNRSTISVGAIKVHGQFNPNETIDITTDSLFSNGSKTSYFSNRISSGTRQFNAHGFTGGYVYNFAKQGKQLTADANLFQGKFENNSLYTTNYFTGNTINRTQYQKIIGDGDNRFLTLQTDFTDPLTANSTFEAGARVQLRKLGNLTENYAGSSQANLSKVPGTTNDYKNTDNVYAGYLNFKSKIKDFGYQIGLRAESSEYNGELITTKQSFSNKYPISLFPSVFLSQKLDEKQEIQFSYTRRINRPNFFQQIPFTDYSDSLNITRGNPGLVPEFTNSFEMSYSKNYRTRDNLLASIYYKHTNDLITRYLTEGINDFTGKSDIINTYINANSSYSLGAEVTSINYINKVWDMTTNVNVYQSKINTDNITGTSQDALISWFGKWNNNIKLKKNYSFQLSANYQSKTNLPVSNNDGGRGGGPFGQAQSSAQGYIRSSWSVDFAVKKSFLKNNAASVSLSINDIFRTRVQDQYSESEYFIQNYNRLNNPQTVRLNFTYRFGKMDMSIFKRQNSKSSGTQDMMQMAQ